MRRKRNADNGSALSLYSQPFYTSKYGYKMCCRVYLNGDGLGKDQSYGKEEVIKIVRTNQRVAFGEEEEIKTNQRAAFGKG